MSDTWRVSFYSNQMTDNFEAKRAQWLKEHHATEEDVFRDRIGEYIKDVIDLEPHEAGGIQDTKIRLPDEIQYADDREMWPEPPRE